MHVVATAGHVDHGKSTLVKALTGTDPDRLSEEQARGLTIDLGFASTRLPSGRGVAFIDVPGHVRFLKNMLAGVGSVDAAVFVVAATEGWKPQSEEHLRILELLGIRHGLVALTKTGLADDDLRELARLDVEDRVVGTFLEAARIVEVDAIDRSGIAEISEALDELLDGTPTAADHKRPRLWIDRVFAAKGSGTVVTGTLAGGRVRVGDELTVLPQQRTVRIRALQSLHENRTKVGPGNRVALNLSGISHDELGRGDVLINAGQWHVTRRVDGHLQVLGAIDHPLTRRGAHMAYLGAGEFPVRVRVLGPAEIQPGESGAVRLHLPVGLPLLPGDRFILRESGRGETLGGGEILDVDPIVAAAKARPDRRVERVIAERGRVDIEELFRLTGERRSADVGNWAVDPAVLEASRAELEEAIAASGSLGLDIATLDDFGRALLETVDGVVVDHGHVRAVDAVDTLTGHTYIDALKAAPFAPPDPSGIDRAELRELVRRGDVIEEKGVYFAASAVAAAAQVVAELLSSKPDGVTVAEVRDGWATSRKFAIPLLSYLDNHGITRRRGDLRIGGPRLPPVEAPVEAPDQTVRS
ncbi:MAG: selenocysteine-specific translation elongation factor [Acidimicrobiaceae bacterium]|nr:selenocysteine-specific translation elongation factor [Acidimicrobiaceae bacterium]